jgi:hypothetical protein
MCGYWYSQAPLFNFFRCRPGIHIPHWYASPRLLPLSASGLIATPLLRSPIRKVAQLETKDKVGRLKNSFTEKCVNCMTEKHTLYSFFCEGSFWSQSTREAAAVRISFHFFFHLVAPSSTEAVGYCTPSVIYSMPLHDFFFRDNAVLVSRALLLCGR